MTLKGGRGDLEGGGGNDQTRFNLSLSLSRVLALSAPSALAWHE